MNKNTLVELLSIGGVILVIAFVVVVNIIGGWVVETLWNTFFAARGFGTIGWLVGWVIFYLFCAIFTRKPRENTEEKS